MRLPLASAIALLGLLVALPVAAEKISISTKTSSNVRMQVESKQSTTNGVTSGETREETTVQSTVNGRTSTYRVSRRCLHSGGKPEDCSTVEQGDRTEGTSIRSTENGTSTPRATMRSAMRNRITAAKIYREALRSCRTGGTGSGRISCFQTARSTFLSSLGLRR